MASLRAFPLPSATTPPLPKASSSASSSSSSYSSIHAVATVVGPRHRNVACSKARCSLVVAAEGASPAFLGRWKKTRAVRRTGGGVAIRCATTEDINAEKALVESATKEKMEKTIESMRVSFNSIRTGRANPSMLDKIEVEYYGTPVGLKSMAQVSTPEATTILIQPYDKSSLKMIEKAIVNSNLGMTPNNDGQVIRLIVPPLTEDRRKELTKQVAKHAEDGKIAIRNIRREAVKAYEKLEKERKLSEDNARDLTDDVQKLTDNYIKKVDSIQKQKEKELMTV